MKKSFITACSFLFVFLSSLSTHGLAPQKTAVAFDHLIEVNEQWKYHVDAVPEMKLVHFKSDVDRIQFHLQHVITYLTKHNLPSNQLARQNRLELLLELAKYADQKVFPTNLYHAKRTPYFIDDFGVHCAVGYMIKVSGHSNLSNKISQEHNYDYVKDIKTLGVVEWAIEHGFTLDELAWIQPGYSVDLIIDNVCIADSGNVRGSVLDAKNDAIITFGTFDYINGKSINGLVLTKNFVPSVFSEEFRGDVYDADGGKDKLMVCGALYVDDDTAAIGYCNEGFWKYYTSPNPDLPYPTKIHRLDENSVMVVLSSSDKEPGSCEIWTLDLRNATAFRNMKFNGIVHVIEPTSSGILLGGDMYDINVFKESDSILIQPSMLVSYSDGNFTQLIKRNLEFVEARSIIAFGSGYLIGTKTSYNPNFSGSHLPQLIAYDGDSARVVLKRGNFTVYPPDGKSYGDLAIDVLSLYRNRYLMLGGDISYSNGFVGSSGIVGFDLSSNQLYHSNSGGRDGVSSLDYLSDSLLYITHSNGLSRFGHPVSVPSHTQQPIIISPNPFTHNISVSGVSDAEFQYSIHDLSGREITKGKSTSAITLEESISPGIYTLQIKTQNQFYSQKIMKE